MKLSRDKILALLVCLCVIVTSLLSVSLLLLHTGHTCKNAQHDDSCALCACIEQSRSVFKLTGAALFLAAGAHLLLHRGLLAWAATGLGLRFPTPVALCVRMNR